MATTANAVRIDLRERDKSLTCKEILTLGSVCCFSFFRDGQALEEDGYAILRIPTGCAPGSPPGPYGLGVFQFSQGKSSDEEPILMEWWLVNRLRFLPIGTVTQLSMTVVTEEGVIAEGMLDVLVATVARITTPELHDPEERVAMFRGERGKPGVELVAGEPSTGMDPSIRVAVNTDGIPTVIREVPPCPKDVSPSDVSDYSKIYVLAALTPPSAEHPDGTYGWVHLPKVKVEMNPGDLPGKIMMEQGEAGAWELRQKMMKWNAETQRYEEDNTRSAATIYTVDHVSDHSDGVL